MQRVFRCLVAAGALWALAGPATAGENDQREFRKWLDAQKAKERAPARADDRGDELDNWRAAQTVRATRHATWHRTSVVPQSAATGRGPDWDDADEDANNDRVPRHRTDWSHRTHPSGGWYDGGSRHWSRYVSRPWYGYGYGGYGYGYGSCLSGYGRGGGFSLCW